MKKFGYWCFLIAMGSQSLYAADAQGTKAVLASEFSKYSYAIGLDIGENLKNRQISISQPAFIKGFQDGLLGHDPLMDRATLVRVMKNFQKQYMAQQEATLKALQQSNETKGAEFRKQYAAHPDTKSLEGGILYRVLTPSNQRSSMSIKSSVTVEYEGKKINGYVFDSSYAKNKTTTFQVQDVISGWQKALLAMHIDETWEVVIPPALAYGDHGFGPIGPGETLIFKIHLVSVQ